MDNYRLNFFRELTEERPTYKDMIDFCCDSLILNNSLLEQLTAKDFYFETYCGSDYDEEKDIYLDIYQYFIISAADADRLAEYTKEIVYYNDELDLYILGVTHLGTMWSGVPANWKTAEEYTESED